MQNLYVPSSHDKIFYRLYNLTPRDQLDGIVLKDGQFCNPIGSESRTHLIYKNNIDILTLPTRTVKVPELQHSGEIPASFVYDDTLVLIRTAEVCAANKPHSLSYTLNCFPGRLELFPVVTVFYEDCVEPGSPEIDFCYPESGLHPETSLQS